MIKKHKRVIIVLIVFIVLAGSVGVLALSRIAGSDKGSAIKLLMQVPDKTMPTDPVVAKFPGQDSLIKSAWSKGLDISIGITDIEAGDIPLLSGYGFDDFSIRLEGLIGGGIRSGQAYVMAGKNGKYITASAYADSDGVELKLPDVSSDKVLTLSYRDGDGDGFYKGMKNIRRLRGVIEDFGTLLYDKTIDIYDDIWCEKLDDKTYILTIPKDACESVLEDIREYIEDNEDVIPYSDDLIKRWLTGWSDVRIKIYHNGDDLTGFETKLSQGGQNYEIDAKYLDSAGNSTSTINFKLPDDTYRYSFRDVGSTKAKSTWKLSIKDGDKWQDIFSLSDSLNTGKKSLIIDLKTYDKGVFGWDEAWRLYIKGYIRDLKSGEHITYNLPDMTLSKSGWKLLSMSGVISEGIADNSPSHLQGEIIDVEDKEEKDKFINTFFTYLDGMWGSEHE